MTTTSLPAEPIAAAPLRDTPDRFGFGANWQRFLDGLTVEQISAAEASLQKMLGLRRLEGKTFLDVGCGSGLFSLAAWSLGAHVRSFDFDPKSVACANELRARYAASDPAWVVSQGSALDAAFLESLGQHDIVYSWGVLHHTGAMWPAIDLVSQRVAPDGYLWISIYNDQGTVSRGWIAVKKLYNRLPRFLKPLLVLAVMLGFETLKFCQLCVLTVVAPVVRKNPLTSWKNWVRSRFGIGDRGMRYWTDMVDWVGGWPFEVARPEEIFAFLRDRGFVLQELKTVGGNLGCNDFLFRRPASPDA